MRLALRLLEGVEGLCRPDGGALRARAGVRAGELLVTPASDHAFGDRHVAGDVVNTAQRLQALTRQAIIYDWLPSWSAKGAIRDIDGSPSS